MLPTKTTSTAANLRHVSTHLTLEHGQTNVAVAVKIVALSASENRASASENAVVNTITSPMRTIRLFTKYRISTVMVGIADEIAVATSVLVRAMLFSE